jgi:hypothetical protein
MRIMIVFTLLLPSLAHAQPFGGIGARAEGMGGAFVAIADDATAVYWNPAGVATGATFDFQISKGDAEPGSSLFIGAAMPVVGLSHYRAHTARASPDRQNGGSGRVEIRPLATTNTGITFVQTIVSGLVVGTTARVVRGGIEPFERRTTVDLDAGALLAIGNVRLGVTGRNLREPEFEDESAGTRLKRQVRAGVAFAPRSLPSGAHGPFSLAFDADLTSGSGPRDDMRMAAIGGEYWIAGGQIGGRAGFRLNTLDTDYKAFSGGLTVKLPRSVFVEGQMTKPTDGQNDWNITLRVTF